MSEALASPREGAASGFAALLTTPALAALGLSLATVVVQSFVHAAVAATPRLGPFGLYGAAALLITFGAAFGCVRYGRFSPLFATLTRWCSAGLAVFLLFEPPDLVLAFEDGAWQLAAVERLYWPALAFAVLGFFRPSFVLFAASYIIAVRYLIEPITGYRGATLDIRYLVEMGQYLSICAVALFFAKYRFERSPENAPRWLDLGTLELCIAFNAIAFHFGNYLWSGVAKLAAGPDITSWLLENPTEVNILLAIEKGAFVFAAWPNLTQAIYDGFSTLRPLSNAFVLVTQALAVVAVLRKYWIVLASLAYDALHIGLYLLGGLFFWPWVWINVAVLLAVRKHVARKIPAVAVASCVIVMVLGRPLDIAHFAYLGWYETNAVRSSYIEAQLDNGDWVRLPSAYFGTLSYSVSHGRIDYGPREGHYAASAWSAVPYHDFAARRGCVPPDEIAGESAAGKRDRLVRADNAVAGEDELLTRFVRSRHAEVMTRLGDDGRYNPYLRIHHHPSNPLLYPEFNAVDMREVRRYRLVTESVCLSLEDGRLVRDRLASSSLLINLEEQQ